MRLLLDTCTFLWVTTGSTELSPTARAAFADPGNECLLSVVSAWEIAVKFNLGRLPIPEPPEAYIPSARNRHGIASLPLDEAATLMLGRLPDLHRDPFDRMLVCQALAGGFTLLTPDPEIRRYAVPALW